MKKILVFLEVLLSLVLLASCASKDTCTCQYYEECIGNKCEMKEGHFLFGGTVHIGNTLYRGVVRGNICPDTFLLDAKPLHSQPPSNRTFNIAIKHGNISPALFIPLDVTELGNNTFFLRGLNSHTYFCRHQGTFLFADFLCKVNPDSVETEIYFFPQTAPAHTGPNVYTDTAYATLYRR